jgi:integrase/recombinase XerD
LVTDTALTVQPDTALVPEADPTAELIGLWLHGRGPHTQRAYRTDVARFLAFVGKPLSQITLRDCQKFVDSLAAQGNSRKRVLTSVKSLFTFAHRLGVIPFNITAAIRLPKVRETLSERILPEAAVHQMIARTPSERDKLLLRTLYITGVRVSELAALKWRDCLPGNGDAGYISVFGKGNKTRSVLLPAYFWSELLAHRGTAAEDTPVFASRKGQGHLTTVQILRIVRDAAKRAGIKKKVSPHWLRHCHVSHALQRGALLHVVQQTVGHCNLAVTSAYCHARPTDSSAHFIAG